MFKILVPVNGSDAALEGVRHAIEIALARGGSLIYLVNAQPVLSRHITQFVPQRVVDEARIARGGAALADAGKLIEAAGLGCRSVVLRGEPAAAVARFAADERVDQVVLGTERKTALLRLLSGSMMNRLLAKVQAPVAIVQQETAGKFVPWVLPAAAGLGLAAALLIAD